MQSIKLHDLINRINAKVNGEFEVVQYGTEDYEKYVDAINREIMNLADMPGLPLPTRTRVITLKDPIDLEEAEYRLPAWFSPTGDIRDRVWLVDDDNNKLGEMNMVPPQDFRSDHGSNTCTIIGDKLIVGMPIDESYEDAQIQVLSVVSPREYKEPDDIVMIESVPWLVSSVAAGLAATSPVPFTARNADRFQKEADTYLATVRRRLRLRQGEYTPPRDHSRHSASRVARLLGGDLGGFW